MGPSGKTVGLVVLGLFVLAAFATKKSARLKDASLQRLGGDGAPTSEWASPAKGNGGKRLVIYMAPWCGPCRASIPSDRELADYLSGHGVETTFVVGMDGLEACGDMARTVGRPVLADPSGEWAKSADINVVPHYLVTDASGKILKRVRGAPQGPPADVARYLGL
jgi:thiol-disulfide isomerase/thioredoxin